MRAKNKKKKVKLPNFSDVARRESIKKANAKNKMYEDNLTTAKRKERRIKKAANGCWWIEQFIRGSK